MKNIYLFIYLFIYWIRYCGPGTKLSKRLARGDKGINSLDSACKEHDIAYSQNQNSIEERNKADLILADKAWERVKSSDAGFGERATALVATNIMKAKSKLEMGCSKKRKGTKNKTKSCMRKKGGFVPFRNIVTAAQKSMTKSKNAISVISSALKDARKKQ